MKRILLLLTLCIGFAAQAQYNPYLDPIFEQRIGYPKHGWIFGVGATWGYTSTQETDFQLKADTDSIFFGDFTNSTFIGPYLEAGKFHIFPGGIIINNMDYTVAFKQLRFYEEFEGKNYPPDNPNGVPELIRDRDARYIENNVTVNLNFNRLIQLGNRSFLMPGIGINGDLKVGENRDYELQDDVAGYIFPKTALRASFHARLSYGFKLNRETFLVPSIEVQLHELTSNDQFEIKRRYFHGEYIPIILSCRLLLHKPISQVACSSLNDQANNLSRTKRKKKSRRMF